MANKHLQQLFQSVIEEQLATGQPPYAKRTLIRLKAEGYSETEAKTMMAGIVAYHMSNMIDSDQAFNNSEYEHLLRQLPNFPDTA
ncbi:MAG: hypothetical protein AAFP77_09735 [Bacteroidota bacterium]